MGTVRFGDIELHIHETGYFVHIADKMGTNCGTCRVLALLPQWRHSKEKIVDPRKHYNSSDRMPSNLKSNNAIEFEYLIFSYMHTFQELTVGYIASWEYPVYLKVHRKGIKKDREMRA